jgi:hypothetical protein
MSFAWILLTYLFLLNHVSFEDDWLSSGMLHHVVWWKFTNVSEVLTASIILHGATFQRTVIFILTTVRTWNLTVFNFYANIRSTITFKILLCFFFLLFFVIFLLLTHVSLDTDIFWLITIDLIDFCDKKIRLN